MSNLKKYRLDRKMTQARLAELAGCNQSYIGLVETDRSRLSFKMAEKFGAILRVDPFELIGRDAFKALSDDLEDFLPLLRALTTRYFDVDLLDDDKLTTQVKLRYWICYAIAHDQFSDDDLDMVYRLVEKLKKEDKK